MSRIAINYSITKYDTGKEQEDNNNNSNANGIGMLIVKVAKHELREESELKEECLQQFREWIRKNPDIVDCIYDDGFLLRFLRVKKFSLPMAQQTLLKYLNFRKRFSHIVQNMDYTEPRVLELINNGYIFVCPLRDQFGRRVIITNLNRFDPYKYTSTDMARAHAITYETLIDDEENQIMGFNHVGDGDGTSPAYITIWSITEFATLLKWGEQSYPMRHKACHIINLPKSVKHVVEFACTRISGKLRNRLHIHSTESDLHKHVPREILPAEYGGVVPSSRMIELWKKELFAKRERLLSYDKMKLLNDRGIVTRRNPNGGQNMDQVCGSFRKLNVD